MPSELGGQKPGEARHNPMTVRLDARSARALRLRAHVHGRTVEAELRDLVLSDTSRSEAPSSADLLAGFERFREAAQSVSLADLRRLRVGKPD